MKYNKTSLNNAIITMAENFKQKDSFEALIKAYQGTPRIVEMIVYQIFLNKFDSRSCSDELYDAFDIILNYARELEKNGFVEFKD